MNGIVITTDILFAEIEGQQLLADIYRPAGDDPLPAVLYLHGGGWVQGSRKDRAGSRLASMAAQGVAVVSLDYRLAPGFTYPAPLHDVKAGVRWLRQEGGNYGLRTDKIAVWGASAGGYLATMAGLTSRTAELEGEVGPYLAQSSVVDAVVTWFAPHDLIAVSRRSELEARICPPPHSNALLGLDGPGEEATRRLRESSPTQYMHGAAPPFMIAHGDSDHVVWCSESVNLHANLSRQGVDATLCLLAGAGHEGAAFDSPSHLAMTATWLKSKLL